MTILQIAALNLDVKNNYSKLLILALTVILDKCISLPCLSVMCLLFLLTQFIEEYLPLDLHMKDKDLENTRNSTISVSVLSQSPQEPKIGIKQINNSLAHLTFSGCFDYEVRTGDLLCLHQWAASCTYTH